MASWYVWSGATGGGTGVDWANAYTSLQAAMSAKAVGDTFYVAHDHAQTQGSALTITSKGTVASPSYIYCVNRAGSVPPVSADLRTTATISTTGSFALNLAGAIGECYGITFTAGSGTGSASLTIVSSGAGIGWKLKNCSLVLGASGAGSQIQLSLSAFGCWHWWDSVSVQFSNVNHTIIAGGNEFLWENTASPVLGATIPTALISASANGAGITRLVGLDLSALGSGKTLFLASNSVGSCLVDSCKINAAATLVSGQTGRGYPKFDLVRCDSGSSNLRSERYRYEGVETTESTIVRSGGASDGTNGFSRKIVTTANSKWALPFEATPIRVWNDAVGVSKTITLEGIWGGGAVPNNDEIWMVVEYLGSSGSPIAAFAHCSKADALAAAAALPSSSETWGGSTTKFKMAVTVTPQMKGPLTINVRAAKPSSTFYIDPKPSVN